MVYFAANPKGGNMPVNGNKLFSRCLLELELLQNSLFSEYQKGSNVLDGELLKKYQNMPAAEKIAELKQAIHLDMAPLNLLFAVMTILEPEKVEEIFARLKTNA
jgi:hypothetical protein